MKKGWRKNSIFNRVDQKRIYTLSRCEIHCFACIYTLAVRIIGDAGIELTQRESRFEELEFELFVYGVRSWVITSILGRVRGTYAHLRHVPYSFKSFETFIFPCAGRFERPTRGPCKWSTARGRSDLSASCYSSDVGWICNPPYEGVYPSSVISKIASPWDHDKIGRKEVCERARENELNGHRGREGGV